MKKWTLFALIGLLFSSVIMLSAQTDGTATPDPAIPTPTQAPLELDPLLGISITPPLDITLPEGWQLALRDTYTYRDLVLDADGGLETLPIDVYVGPVTNGTGWIVMLWGYDTILPIMENITEAEYHERVAWLSGLRMLQSVVFDYRCTFGTAPQRDYTIGDLPAIGTTFSAIDCPFEQPDTRGWFAGMNIDNLNFSFFVYADPIQPAGSIVEFELQAIIDTIVFNVDDITVTADEFNAVRDAIALTPRPNVLIPTATP
ncbi:MAG: hypothetical protein WBC91_21985 [Phototrophicaceae bacterium]